jgi:hypothetical protein
MVLAVEFGHHADGASGEGIVDDAEIDEGKLFQRRLKGAREGKAQAKLEKVIKARPVGVVKAIDKTAPFLARLTVIGSVAQGPVVLQESPELIEPFRFLVVDADPQIPKGMDQTAGIVKTGEASFFL